MHEVHEERLKSAQTEILSEKTLRYRRNVLVLSAVLFIAHAFGAEFGELSLIGVKLLKNTDSKFIALALLWLANLYNLVLFWFYGKSDWNMWVENLTGRWPEHQEDKKFFFPELQMYWEKAPKSGNTRRNRLGSNADLFKGWVGFDTDKFKLNLSCYAVMEPTTPNQNQPSSRVPIFTVPMLTVKTVKRQVRQLMIIEVLLPFLILALAGLGLAWDISH